MFASQTRMNEVLKGRIQTISQDEQNKLFLVGPIKLPVALGQETVIFQWYSWLSGDDLPETADRLIDQLPARNLADLQQSSVLVYGDFQGSKDAVIRFHSICHTGDIFGSKRCDCGYQLKQSMREIVEYGSGALFYLANHEGRGIGLFSKALTYLLQENGYDTVDANLALGFQEDQRSYNEAVLVLQALRQKKVTLLTNNPNKLRALRAAGLQDTSHANLWGDVSNYNRTYIKTKVARSGHLMKDQQKKQFLQTGEIKTLVSRLPCSNTTEAILRVGLSQTAK
jgi:GTP cyclohydrolase II